mgnify:CR=1 FL=1
MMKETTQVMEEIEMTLALRLFLSMALQQAIESCSTEGSGTLVDWMGEQIVSSTNLLFPTPFEA